jgi:steroid 5-alpha reductase family enzyme
MFQSIVYSVVVVLIYMLGLFVAAMIKKDNSIADIAWGLGFVVIAGVNLCIRQTSSGRQLLITGVMMIWAFRLAGHILVRNKGRGEDFRYAQWREEWGKNIIIKTLLNVFLLQGLLMVIIAYPVILVHSTAQPPLNFLDVAGFVIWLIGFFFESVGDYQLLKFKKERSNRGNILTSGVWKYTRHPNYFGEVTIWWGIFMIALSAPYGLTALISPMVITFLLLKVSGVPMLEKKYHGNPEFMEYARKTSRFIPRFPHV